MRRLLLAATAAIVLGGAGAGAAGLFADAGAQPAPPPAVGGPPGPGGGPGGPDGGWRMGPHPGWMAWRQHAMHRVRTFGLLYHTDDRQLTAPEVQKIAEAFLLWNGNRTWKVTEVATAPDGKIGFAFATPDGSVIARFTMDGKTGRVERTG